MKFRRLLVFVLLALGLFLAWRFLPASKEAAKPGKSADAGKPVSVTTIAVAGRDVPIWLSGLGTVEASNTVVVRPRVGGMLDQINFTEGQLVKAGDVLARIDPRPYASRLAQAQAKVAQTTAQLGIARRDLDRISVLAKSGAESRQIFEQSEAKVAEITAQEQADSAALDAARLDLDFTTITAPISGRTGLRIVDQGNLVTANQESGLVTIRQFQPVAIVFRLPQNYLPEVRKRMLDDKTPVITQAVTDTGAVLAEGALDLIDNHIDVSSGTMKMKSTFLNTKETLWPGQFLTARLLVKTCKQALVVPTQVIVNGLNGPFAYVVKADGAVDARNVKTGPRVDDITIIEDGLKSGEQVVLDGQSKLQPHARVTVQSQEP